MPQDLGYGEPQRYYAEAYDSDNNVQHNKSKKNGNSKGDKQFTRVGTAYAGCILEKAAARVGERESWSRVGRSPMPGNDTQLANLSRKYRQKVGEPIEAFSRLDSEQKGVVLRYIEMQQRQETDKNALWSLDCVVQRVGKIRVKNAWTSSSETKHIKVIIKREDRSRVQGGIRSSGHSGHFAAGEIIDLAEPLPRVKGPKKSNKKNNFDHEPMEEAYMGPPFNEHHDPFAGLGQEQQDFMPPPPPPQQPFPHTQHPPPGAIPVGGYHPTQYNGQANPFEPHPQFNTPDLYEDTQSHVPMQADPMFQTRRQTPIEEQRGARSYSHERRQEARENRRMLEEEERHAARLEQEEDRRQQRMDRERTQRKLEELNGNILEQQDQMQMLTGKFAELGHSGRRAGGTRYSASSDGSLYRDNLDKADMWSVHSGASFTPPSSPGRASPILPSGTLGRAHSKRYRDGGRAEHRDSYHLRDSQVVLEPYNNTQNSRDRVQYRHVSGRISYGAGNEAVYEVDDYPRPPPGAPMPPSDPSKRHRRPQIHQHHRQQQRARTFGGNDTYPLPALPEFSGQEYADFGERRSRSRRRGRHGGSGRKEDRQYAYAADGRDHRGTADRGFYI